MASVTYTDKELRGCLGSWLAQEVGGTEAAGHHPAMLNQDGKEGLIYSITLTAKSTVGRCLLFTVRYSC